MQPTNPYTVLLLVSNNLSLIEATRTSLTSYGPHSLNVKKGSSENLSQNIADTQPQLILLDLDFDAEPIKLIQGMINSYPHIAIVPVLTEAHMVDADQVLLTGARTFVKYPYQQDALTLTVSRAITLLQSEQASLAPLQVVETPTKPGNIFTVFSPKGGAGTTTVAVNLAISLHKQIKEDVLLIDGKLLFGHVSLYLNIRTGNSITDLIPHIDMIDKRLINQVVVRHGSGIKVLPSPLSIHDGQGIRPDDLFKILQALQQEFPHIIIDAGSHLNDNSVTYMDASNKILLVANPNIASLRDARQFMEVTATLSYPREKTLLLLYQAGRKSDVKKEDIENILKMKVFGIIPADENQALSSLNEGIPLVIKKPMHPISRAFTSVAKNLVQVFQSSDSQEDDKPANGKNKRDK
jgi:pilus assembly protein CpaE